jgi:hypothetical protein
MVAIPQANQLITVSDQGCLIVSELTSGDELQTLYPVSPYRHAIKTLVELPDRKSIVATDYLGSTYIWNYDPSVTEVCRLESQSKSEIRGLQIYNNLLCVG